MFPVATSFWILGTISISTSLVLTNKFLFSTNFTWPIILTTFHFILTYFLLEIMCLCNLFQRGTAVPSLSRWLLGFYNVAGIVFMNFNLKMNSIGFYQLSKLCTIPVMVLYEYLFLDKKQPINILITLCVLLIGLCLFTVNDVQFNVSGSVISVIAVITTAISQTQNNQMQRAFGVNGPSMQHIVALQQAALAFVAAMVVEGYGPNSFIYHSFGYYELVLILLTGILAVGSNICAFAIIGKTSAVTYQVVGHVKTILIFIFGLVMFPPPKGETQAQFLKKIFGLIISMVGVVLYTYFKLTAVAEKPDAQVQPLIPSKESILQMRDDSDVDKKDGQMFLPVDSDHE